MSVDRTLAIARRIVIQIVRDRGLPPGIRSRKNETVL